MKKHIIALFAIGAIIVLIICTYLWSDNSIQTIVSTPETKAITYRNEQFGFEIILPPSWDKNQLTAMEVFIPEHIDNRMGISLGYSLDKAISGENRHYIYNIYIVEIEDWSEVDPEVVWELGRNDKFVFGFSPSNDLNVNNENENGILCLDETSLSEQHQFCKAYNDLKKLIDEKSPAPFNFEALATSATFEKKELGIKFNYPLQFYSFDTTSFPDHPFTATGWKVSNENDNVNFSLRYQPMDEELKSRFESFEENNTDQNLFLPKKVQFNNGFFYVNEENEIFGEYRAAAFYVGVDYVYTFSMSSGKNLQEEMSQVFLKIISSAELTQ